MTAPLKIAAVEPCGFVNKCMASPQSYASQLSGYSTPSAERVAAYALQQLEAARQKDIDTHARNLPLLEQNKAVRAHIEAVMDAVGMPKRWSERDTASRSRYPKTITRDAGYLSDLLREVKTSDGFEYATSSHERLLKDYEAYAARAKTEAEHARGAAERQRQAEIEKRKADMELASLLLRYSLPIESTWRDVLDALTSRDQRLALAVAMQQTRMDWSEGPYRVRDALGGFQIETTEDKDIATDVLACLEDFCDGRVFRDTRWSYDALFASVKDPQLAKDCQAALSRIEP